jgi:hypothetical protein
MAHRCSLAWIPSTRASASSSVRNGVGDDAPVFTGDLLACQRQACELAAPLRHVHASRVLGLLRRLRPLPKPTADSRPARHRAGRAAGRAARGGFPRSRDDRLTGAVPSSSPAASPRVRRRPSPWPPATPEIKRGSKSPPPGQTVGVRCIPAPIHQVGAGDSLTGVPPLVHSSLHLPVLLARPEPSGGAGPPCRCQGCSHRSLGLQEAAALSFAVLLRQARRWSPFTSTRSPRASWRTFRRNQGTLDSSRAATMGWPRSVGSGGDRAARA